jgi:hypothetical protein
VNPGRHLSQDSTSLQTAQLKGQALHIPVLGSAMRVSVAELIEQFDTQDLANVEGFVNKNFPG